jgi:hypothetical protein
MLEPESVRRFSSTTLELEGLVLNILLFIRIVVSEVKSISKHWRSDEEK